jgi:hypothetical protein
MRPATISHKQRRLLVLKDCQFPWTVREAKIFRKMLKEARDANVDVYFTLQRVRDMGRALKKVDHLFVINVHLSSRETDHMHRLLTPWVDPMLAYGQVTSGWLRPVVDQLTAV